MTGMTVIELIEELKKISKEGFGHARIMINEKGDGYFGDLLYVDTLLVHPGDAAITLISSSGNETE